MQLLTGTLHTFRVATGSAVTVDVFASYVDKSGSTFTPGNQATAISTIATTPVVSAPAASTQRNLKSMSIRNRHATTSTTIIVQFFDGTTAFEIYGDVLAAGAELIYEDGQGWTLASAASSTTQQVFVTGSGTYTTPAGVVAIKVECVAGGGAGGGCATAATNSAAAGGGGAGSYSVSVIATPAATYAYAVGAGGTPGAAGANNGGAGVDSTFNATTVVAKGGSGGLADTVTTLHAGGLGGAGGVAGTGDFKPAGAPGGNGVSFAAAQCLSGAGGSSVYGGGGVSAKNATGTGVVGTSGGGGSGATIISGGANQAGAAGGAGLIIVTEYR